ncbi:hypothetical protein VTL71DRAFT_5317 [Oculimacula yallundae]|uniref:Abscission/NoCut checkpoint regulator n=1 Tax=Oculimacula yallundae TaxID=86028 RepID=A0ABR4C1S8_9HELO
MSNPPSYDQHLLDRLNALRKSSVELDPSKTTPIPKTTTSTPETDLSARLKSLRNGTSSPSSPSPSNLPQKQFKPTSSSTETTFSSFPSLPSEDEDPLRHGFGGTDDDKTLDELLADLGPDDQWTLNPDDPKDIKKLLDEARGALPRHDESGSRSQPQDRDQDQEQDQDRVKDSDSKTYLSRDLDMSVFALEDGDGDEESGEGKEKGKEGKGGYLEREAREAQDIVQRMMDEVNLERDEEKGEETEDEKDKDASASSKPNAQAEDEDDHGGLSLPSAPSTLPSPPTRKSLDFESDITSRLSALSVPSHLTDSLGLPSAPTFAPIDKPVKGVMKKKFTDEEVDSWCIICQDDATVKCVGCDGDLYCAACWKEGHMGPDIGFEEKGHKWVKWRKPN